MTQMMFGIPNLPLMIDAYDHGQKVIIQAKTIPSHHSGEIHILQTEAALAFREMHAAAARDGIELRVNSSFRGMKEQRKLFYKKGSKVAAKPGFSNHQSGTAVDIANTELYIPVKCERKCPTLTYWWLKRNARQYGFKQTVPHERWHWQFIQEDNS
jgi:D-alanyl-D-alanine carboxypeptidase